LTKANTDTYIDLMEFSSKHIQMDYKPMPGPDSYTLH